MILNQSSMHYMPVIDRQSIFIETKLNGSSRGYNGAIHGIESALKRLNTDYIDLLLIHEPYKESIEMYHAMQDMYAKGILKAIGVSNFDQHHYDAFIQQVKIIPMVNQMESHVYYPNHAYQQYLASHGTIM